MNARRKFLASGLLSTGFVATGALSGFPKGLANHVLLPPAKPLPENEPIPSEKVNRFVGVSHGDFETVKSMTEEIPQLVNCLRDWGNGDFESAINAASHVGNRQIAEFLLEKGARLDCFAATMLGLTSVMKEMLKCYPNLHEVRGAHGIPMIMHAIFGRESADDVFYLLLEAGADVNAMSNIKMTPLMAATRVNRVSMVKLLLEKGSDPAQTDDKGLTALAIAEKQEFPDIVAVLKEAMKD